MRQAVVSYQSTEWFLAMINFFTHLSPIWQALIATTFTWLVTALGAATVFLFKQVNRKLLDGMLGFAAGVSRDLPVEACIGNPFAKA